MAYSSIVRVLMAAMAIAAVAELAMADDYHVGDESGWTLGVDYSKWVEDKTFVPGDVIIFRYSIASHDVVEVNATDYAACSVSNPIDTFRANATFITVDAVGKRYFICGTPNHCAQGMKVEIDVVDASSKSPSPSSFPSGSPPATSAAGGSTYVQAKAALLGVGMLAAAAFALVM